jgi:SAM-dependent methyltransferase
MMRGGSGESFDTFADDYERLLDDPLRKQFASDGDYFIRVKCAALTREIRRQLAPRSPGARLRVLDAGCGLGTAMEYLGGDFNIVGTDISHAMLQHSGHHGRVAVQEPFDLPFASDAFDVAFAFCVYHHLDAASHVRHLRELGRVVRPGGLVCVFEHNPFNPATRIIFARAPIDRGCRMIWPSALRRTFLDAGLSGTKQGYLLFVPELPVRWFAFLEPALAWLPLGGQYFVSGRKPAP